MSVDYFLICGKHNDSVYVGCVNFSGVHPLPDDHINDIRTFVKAHYLCPFVFGDENKEEDLTTAKT